eukprot:PITA_12481
MDDFTPYGDEFDPAIDTLEKVLQRCIATRICLSHEKCYMMMMEGLILGHYILAAGIQVDPAKIQTLLLIPTPTTQTEVRIFLGFSGYYRRFIEHYSHIAAPLYALTGNVDFLWIEKCERAFKDLRKLVPTAPVLRGPNWDLPFQISSDASDTTIGAVLRQEEDRKPYEFDITIKDRPGKENPVADFLSRMPKPVDAATVEDQFPDEHLFVVVVQTPWYADIANYLAVVPAPSILRHGLPREIITDGGPQFAGNKIAATLNNYHVQHKITTPYHPHANGQVESSNKIIETILTKNFASHRCDWAARLPEALWAYRTTWRSTTGYSPYQLMFGKQPIFPIEFEIQTLRTTQEVGLELTKAQINQLQQINDLDEIRLSALQHTA